MTFTDRARAILARAELLDAYLANNGLSSPSFDEDTLDALPSQVQDLRWSLANDANDIKKLARGPVVSAMDIALSVCHITHLFGIRS
jgi:hypothetical protein